MIVSYKIFYKKIVPKFLFLPILEQIAAPTNCTLEMNLITPPNTPILFFSMRIFDDTGVWFGTLILL